MATTDPSIPSNPSPSVPSLQPYAQAFERVKPEVDALRPDDLLRITVDLARASTRAVAVVPRMMAHRETIVRDLPSFDIAKLDKLRDYADAVFFVEVDGPSSPIDPALQPLLEEATPLRDRMLNFAEAFAKDGMLDADRVAQIRSGTGYLDTVKDLGSLAEMYRKAWSQLQGKCPITAAEVDRAGALSHQLREAVAEKGLRTDLGERTIGVDADRRARVFTLFVKAYEKCRAAIHYIRSEHGDAESIAPTVFVRSRKSAKTTAEAEDTLVPGAAPSPAPSGDETD